MVGHALAKAHIYKSKYTSLRTYWLTDLSCVCPWSSAWSSTLLSLDLDQLYGQRSYLAAPTLLGNDATREHGLDPWLSFSPSLWPVLFLLLPWEEQVQHCHHVSYTNKQYFVGYCWHVVKPFIAVLMLYSSSGAVVLWGAPYIRWARTCMGLTMAGACAKHQPCYWSQTGTQTFWLYSLNNCH